MMKKITLLFFIFLSFIASAQEDAWVYFTNKPDAAYYLANPLEMLSQRALDRRTNQNIALNSTDVPISQTYITSVTNATGITVLAKSKWMNALHVRGTIAAIQNLGNLNFVDHIQFANSSLNSRTASSSVVFEGNKSLETQISYNYGTSANQIQMLNGHHLHQQDYTGNGKIIAVLDAGFPGVNTIASFQHLRDNNKILGGYDFVNRSTNFYTGGTHGTLVLSTMGGYVENQLIGTAPDASYYLFITEDMASENPVEESYWVEAAEMADSLGVDIINTSLGYFTYNNPDYSYEYSDMNGTTAFISRGADIAFSKGMICVVSAGNSGASANPHIGAPADAVNVLSVGAVSPSENYASFSSIGPSFDGRVKPDVAAQGQNVIISNASGNIGTASGTSFAGPIIAGMVASFWQALPDKTNAEIIQLIKQSAHLYANPTVQMGYGIPDFSVALNLNIPGFSSEKMLLYPNPANNSVNLQLPNSIEKAEIYLYNTLGQPILKTEITSVNPNLSISSLASGMYLYKIISGKASQTGKLIKN